MSLKTVPNENAIRGMHSGDEHFSQPPAPSSIMRITKSPLDTDEPSHLRNSQSWASFHRASLDPMDAELRRSVQLAIEQVYELVGQPNADVPMVANLLKQQLDRELSPNWQVIVGRSFICHVSHQKGTFGYFQNGPHKIVVYKTAL